MVTQCRPLIEVLREIPDVRHARGKRHPLAALRGLIGVAALCGYRSYSAIAPWARIYPRDRVVALGLTHPTPPCAATLSTVLRQLDPEQIETKLGAWAESILATLPPEPLEDEAVALDGKTLRGSQRQGALNVPLLSALSRRLGLTLGQQAVDAKTNEISHVLPLLRGLVLDGRIVTMDALLTQRAVAQTIVDGGGQYVMVVKGNQPRLEGDVALIFTEPPPGPRPVMAETRDGGHGRIERRRLTVSDALVGYSTWPGLQQVFRLERETLQRTTGEIRAETVYGVTSLDPTRADAQRLLRLTRHHWHIENRSHGVRDVTFDEDRSHVRCGNTPDVMAACRRLAASPRSALTLIGITPDN